jgi:hypothetical protein
MQDLAEQTAERLGARGYAEVLTAQSRNNVTPGDLATVGPSVTLTVPTNALVMVMAQITVGAGAFDINVFLAEDGAEIGHLFTDTGSVTLYSAPGDDIGDGVILRGNATPSLFPASAGSHTYKLTYSTSGSMTFSNRKLWVATIPF